MAPPPLRVYGFDPGTLFGWSVWDVWGDGTIRLVASGVWKTLGSKELPGRRFKHARESLMWLLTKYPAPPGAVVVIGYEDINVTIFKNKDNLRVYTGLVAQIWEAAAVAGITDVRGIAPSTLKKHAVGYASKKVDGEMVTVTKAQMCDACIKRFSIEPETDDHADALFVGHYFAENPCPPPPKKKTKKKRSTSTSRTTKRNTRSTPRGPSSARAPSRKKAPKKRSSSAKPSDRSKPK